MPTQIGAWGRAAIKNMIAIFKRPGTATQAPLQTGRIIAAISVHFQPRASADIFCRHNVSMPTRSRQWVFRMPNKPLCQRAEEDKRRADLSEDAWKGSGKVYGYRKLHPAHCSETNDCRAADQISQFTSIEWAPFLQ